MYSLFVSGDEESRKNEKQGIKRQQHRDTKIVKKNCN